MGRKYRLDLGTLEERINGYFSHCDLLNSGEKNDIVKPYTLSGLLCYVGLGRKEFDELCESKKYKRVLLSAKAKIEAFIEENALTGEISCNASLNSLKYHFGWGERPEKEASEASSVTVRLCGDDVKLAR